jgi:hypothetical protein
VVIAAWRRLPRALVAVGLTVCVVAALLAVAWPSHAAAAWSPVGAGWGATQSDRYAYSGRYSLYLARDPQGKPVALQQQFTDPQLRRLLGRTVVFSAFVRSGADATTGRVALNEANGLFTQNSLAWSYKAPKSEAVTFNATPNWQKVSLQVAIPREVMWAALVIELDGPGELYIDQVQVVDSASGTPVEALSNTGGEETSRWWQARFSDNQITRYLTRIIQSASDGIYVSPEAGALYPYFLTQLFSSLVGRFGWMTLDLRPELYWVVWLISAALLAGLALGWRRFGGLEPTQRRVLASLVGLVLLAMLIIMLDYTSYLFKPTYPQGRYLFPVLPALVILLVSGLAQLVPARYDRVAVPLFVGLLLALDLWSWAGVILPHFYA